jgi:hypothetical protein
MRSISVIVSSSVSEISKETVSQVASGWRRRYVLRQAELAMQTTRLGISLSCGLFGLILWVTSGDILCGAAIPSAVAPTQTPSRRLLPIQQDSKWGYINEQGEIVIKPQFDEAREFSDGLAFVRYPNRAKPLKPGQTTPELIIGQGFIDETGKVVLELEHPAYLAGDNFYDGLTKFWTGESGRTLYGFIDTSGRVRIKPQFTHAYEFIEGLCAVCISDEKCGFIDKDGSFAIEPKYRTVFPFMDGFAVVGFDLEKIGFVNKSGVLVVEPRFGHLIGTGFSEGLSAIAYPYGKYGYINTQGELVIPMQFDQATPFSEGLAAVSVDGKWGYIDKSGKFVIQPQYRDAGRFSEGLAPINSEPSLMATDQTGVGTGYIDKTGTLIIARPFGNATSFVDGIAKVYEHGKMGYINKKGNYIWKPTR